MKNFLIVVLIIVIGCTIGWYMLKPKTIPQLGIFQKNTSVTTPTPQDGSYNPVEVSVSGIPSQGGETKGGIRAPNGVVAETLVSYTDDGFHDPVVYIKLGSTVVFRNDSSKDMWVASAPHPTHTAYPEFDEKKSVARGATYSFTFTKVGAWKYHNHMIPGQTGTVVVQQ